MKKTLHLLANKLIYLLILLLGLSINSFGAVSYIQSGAHLFLDKELEKFNYSGTNFTLELSQEVKESIKKAKNNGYYVEFSSWHGDNTNNWDYKSGYEHLTTELVNTNGEYTGLKIKNSGYNPTHYIIIAVRIYNNAQISNSTYCTVIKSIIKPADHFLADNFKIQGNSSNKGFVCNYGGDGKETYNAVKSWNSRFGTFNSVTYKWTLSGNIKATSGTTGTAGSTYTSVTIDGNKGSGNGTLKLSVSFSYKIGSTTYSTTKDYSVAVTVKDVNGFKSSNQWPGDHYTWGGNLWTGSKLGDNDTLALTVPAPSNSSGIVTYTWQSSTNEDKSGYSNCGASTKDYSISKTTYSTHYRRIDQENYCYNSSGKKPQDYAKFNSSNSPQFTVYIPLTASVSGAKASGAVGSSLTTLNYGEKAVLTCSTSGSFKNSSKTYNWQSKSGSGSWTSCGSNSASITVTSTTTETEYRCVVSDSYNTNIASSNTVKVKCYPALTVGNISGGGVTVNNGENVTLSVSPSGGAGAGSYTYEWHRSTTSGFTPSSSTKIANSNSASITTTSSSTEAQTYYYKCKVYSSSNTSYTVTSNQAAVSWYKELSVTLNKKPNKSVFTNGETLTLSCTATGGNGNYTYKWRYANIPINFFTLQYDIPGDGSSITRSDYRTDGRIQMMTYIVTVTSNNVSKSCHTGLNFWLPKTLSGAIDNAGSDYNTIGNSVTLSIKTESIGIESYESFKYQWYEGDTSEGNKISGATSYTYTASSSSETSKTYYCKISYDGTSTVTDGHTVYWYNPLSVGTATADKSTLPAGGSTTLRIGTCSGAGGIASYNWYRKAVSGESSDTWLGSGSSCNVGGSGYANGTLQYYCQVKGSVISTVKNSNTVSIKWNPALSVGNISGGGVTQNNGTNVTLSVSPSGGAGAGSYTYEWHRSTTSGFTPSSSTKIANSNSASITTTSSSTDAQTYYYKCKVYSSDNTSNVLTTNQTYVTWYKALSVTTSCTQSGKTVPYGTGVSMSCTASGGNGTYTYQWQYSSNLSSWTNASDGTSPTTTRYDHPTNSNSTWYYRVKVTSNGASVYSSPFTVSWNPALSATISNSGSDKNTIGTSVTLTANPTGGNGSYTYQWYAGGTSDSYKISGATSKSYTVSYSTETSKTFYCKVTSNGTSSNSSGHTVNWYSAVTAGTISGSGSLASGKTTKLTVSGFNGDGGNGNASNYTFQWYADGTAISGATSTSITVGGSVYVNKTVKYKCLIKGKNLGSSAYASEVTVTWNPALTVGNISVTSGSATNNKNGASVILAVSPNGGAGANSYTYKWHRSTTKDFTPSNSTLIANSNSATITTTSSGTNAQTYYYKCVVTSTDDTSHEVTSSQTSVSWFGALSVTASCDKNGTTVSNGSSVPLNCSATGGNGSYSYQWQYKYAGIDWTNLSTTQNTSAQNTNPYTYQYRVIVTSNGESITSDIIIITWAPMLHASISCSEGSGRTFNLGANQSITLTCSAEGGNGIYSYQWYYNNGNVQIMPGKTNNTLIIGTDKAGVHEYYLCKVTSIDQTICTDSIYLWWDYTTPTASIQQVSDKWAVGTERPYGKSVTLNIETITGGSPLKTYSWQSSSDNNNFTDIAGKTGTIALLDNSQSGNKVSYWYRLKVHTYINDDNGTNGYDVYSNAINVIWQPKITARIESTRPKVDETATLTCTAGGGAGEGSYKYQWLANGILDINEIPDATSNTFVTEAYSDTTITYYCRIVSNQDTLFSTGQVIVWHPGLYAIISGGNVTVSSGDAVELRANVSGGTNYNYVWYEDGNIISGSTETKIFTHVNANDTGNEIHTYKVVVSADDAEEPFTSEEVTITWLPELIPGEISNNEPHVITSGEEIEIGGSGAQGGNGVYTYRWEKCDENDNGIFVVIDGANTPMINVSPTINTKYRRYDISGTQEKLAFEVNVVLPLYPGKLLTNDTTICFGSKFADIANVEDPIGGGKCSYQWKYFTDSTFGELINVDSVASDGKYLQGYELTQTTWFVRYCYYTNIPEVAGYSDTVKVTVLPQLTLSMPVDQNLCSSDQLGTLKVEAQGGTGNYSYKWFANYVDFDNVVLSTTDSLIDSHFGSSTKTEGTTIYTVEVYDKCTDVMSGYATGNFSVTQRKSLAKGNSSFDESTIINQATINIGDTGTSTLYSNTLYNISDYYTYSWYYKTEGNDAWLQINHADSNKYIVDHSAYTMNTYFKYSITDNICEDTIYGDSLLLTVINSAIPDKPTLNNGTGMSICYNTVPSSISINNIGSETYTAYSWFAKAIDENSYSQLENESGNTLTFDSNQALKVSTYFKARLYMSNGKYVDTDPILITVLGEILPGEIGIGQNHLEVETIKHGTTPSMILSEIDAECDSVFQYQWYKKTEGQMDFETIVGATGKDYQPESLTETTMFYRSAISYCTEVYSNIVKFVIEESEFTIANLKKRYCYGEDVSISVEGTTGTTYKWTASDGNLLSTGKDLKINRLTQNTNITLSSYDKDMNKTGEKSIDLTIVKLSPAFTCSKLSIEAGDVVHFDNESNEFATCVWDFGDGSDGSNMTNPWHYYNEQGTFDVTLTIISEEGCTETMKQSKLITAEGWLGGGVDIDGEIAATYKVYPNPVKDKLTVEMQQSGKVTLYDETNKVLFVSNEDETVEIDMTPYPQGIYILSVENDGNINRTKVVKY